MNGDSVKKILNNGAFIANLAPLLKTPEGDELASAAQAYAAILDSLGIKPDVSKFTGCDQATKLIGWIFGHEDEKPDSHLIAQWTVEIIAAIAELAAGNLPTTHEQE